MDENQRWQVTPVSAEVELEIGPGDRELILAPGLMDMQINGYCGVDFNQPDQLSLEKIFSVVAAQRALGVAYFLPTITTGSFERMSRSLALIAEAMEDDNWGQSMPGIHMEGPYISAEDGPRGAHPQGGGQTTGLGGVSPSAGSGQRQHSAGNPQSGVSRGAGFYR